LNIDPDKVHGWIKRYGDFVSEESDEFNTRLRIAIAQDHATLPRLAIVMDSPTRATVGLRQFAAWWVRQIGWPAPPELLAMADEHDPGKQKTPTSAEGTAKVELRAHNKRNTEARNHEWQERINKLAQDSPGKSHSDYCRTLAKQTGALSSFSTIRRNTKLRHR
jgi:hypothetical protein